MNIVLWMAAALLALMAFAGVFLLRRLALTRTRRIDLGPWLNDFSIERYRPMERLLTPDDYDFLAGQPGYRPEMIRKLRAERRRIFRKYLRALERDFERIYGGMKLILLQSLQDRPDLGIALVKQRLLFASAMTAVEFRLALHVLGGGSVDAGVLLDSLAALRGQLQQLMLAPRMAAA